jgi:Flavin containing amine oxidoreductase
VWSRRLGNGSLVEMGAEFILAGNTVLERAVDRLGLAVWEKGMAYGRREPRGADAVTEADLRAAAVAIERAGGEGESAAAVLARVELRDPVREAVRARVEVSAAATAEAVGADELHGAAAFDDSPSYGVAGGDQALAHALAARLRVHLETAVRRVTWGGTEVRVGTASGDVRPTPSSSPSRPP